MPVPDFQTVMLPFLKTLSDGEEWLMRDVTEHLAAEFKLSPEERQEMLPSNAQTLISNRVAWAKTHLKNAGLLENPKRGVVKLSARGKSVLAENPLTVNCKFLKQFPSYLEFIGQPQGATSHIVEPTIVESSQTPQELLDTSFATIQKATTEDLLSRLKKCSPFFFEQVVVRLLQAMGYGGFTGDANVTGQSGDGGIDGIIKEDKLGLDIVCLQAKRWEGSVGRPVVQAFVGSMDYIRAKKGVILTTSHFTKEALDFVRLIEGKKVVLIDGHTLTQLMIENNVGVNVVRSYEIKEVSDDFFDEDEG